MVDPATDLDRAVAAMVEQSAANSYAATPWPPIDWSLCQERSSAAPAFPVDIFGYSWAQWISAAAEGAGCAPDYVALPLLGLVGAMLANVRRGQPWAGWSEPPSLNCASVGNPSSGKSSGGRVVNDLAKKLEDYMNADSGERRLRHATECAAALERGKQWEGDVKNAVRSGHPPPDKPKDAIPPPEFTLHRLVTTDPTPQAMVRLVKDNPRGLLVFRDELAGWLGSMDQYGGNGNDRALWLEAWGGGTFAQDRIKDEEEPRVVHHLAVSIVGTIQPDRIASTLLKGDDDGLAARFLYTWPDQRPPKIPSRSADFDAAQTWLQRLCGLKQLDGEHPRLAHFDREAVQAIQQLRCCAFGMEGKLSGRLLSWIGKNPGFALRLATVIRFMRWIAEEPNSPEPDYIRGEDVEAAKRLLGTYFWPMALRVFGDTGTPEEERDATALARWIFARRHQIVAVNARALRRTRVLGANANGTRYEAALDELERAGWVRPMPRFTGGRPSKEWLLNPILASQTVA